MLLIVVVSSKPNTPGIVPFAIGTFNNASNEIVMAYADLNLD